MIATARFLRVLTAALARRMEGDATRIFWREGDKNSIDDFNAFVKSQRRTLVADIFEIQIAHVDRVGPDTAAAIAAKFGAMKGWRGGGGELTQEGLYDAYLKCPLERRDALLSDLVRTFNLFLLLLVELSYCFDSC
jgi:hypothetical protein